MLAEAARSPATNWRAKDCAIYLVTALTVRGKTAAAGATATNTLVNLQDFFQQVRGLGGEGGSNQAARLLLSSTTAVNQPILVLLSSTVL